MPVSWRTGGLVLGIVFFLAVLLVKPIGVSTQFVIFDAIVSDMVNPEYVVENTDGSYTSPNAYLAKSNGKYAKNAANPWNYSFVFVLAMMVGAALSVKLRGGLSKREQEMPALWRANFGDSTRSRFIVAFLGGFVVLFGARLAGGCTSGHMMSGMMQTAVSGYLFAAGAFLTAIPVALLMFRKEV